MSDRWDVALPVLVASALTDWLDGLAARRSGEVGKSTLGSYLDPLADKALVACVVGALGYAGALSAPLVAVVVSRDAVLVAGAFAVRARELEWRWPGARAFFRVAGKGAAHAVKPLFVSKVNTTLQLALVSGAVARAAYGWPPAEALDALGAAVAVTTLWSLGAYLRLYLQRKI